MDFLTLHPTRYTPEKVVDGYTNCVWTERFQTPGEFELITPRIKKTMELLPKNTLVSLRDSREMAIVERHEIKEGLLTVKGKTLDLFLKHRTVIGPYGKKIKMAMKYNRRTVIEVILWNSFVNNSGKDVLRASALNKNNKDVIPNAIITESLGTTSSGPVTRRWLGQGQVDTILDPILKNAGLGIRVLRPLDPSEKVTAINVAHLDANRGLVSRPDQLVNGRLQFNVYNGTDRTTDTPGGFEIFDVGGKPRDPGLAKQIVFRLDMDHIKDPQYLFSEEKFKNLAEVRSKLGNKNVWRNNKESSSTGFQVKRLLVDAGEPDDGETAAEFKDDLPQMGEEALAANNRIGAFDASVTESSPYKYGRDYFLGDKVTLIGDYGFERTMTVTEFIRTDDGVVDQGFPTFEPKPVEDGVSTDEGSGG